MTSSGLVESKAVGSHAFAICNSTGHRQMIYTQYELYATLSLVVQRAAVESEACLEGCSLAILIVFAHPKTVLTRLFGLNSPQLPLNSQTPCRMVSYKRIQIVGKGSFGCCWLVKSESGEKCILKEIDVSTMSKKQQSEAATEVTVLSNLRHPFIIKYRESFLDGSLLCIVMDFAEHGDLFSAIERQKKSGSLFQESLVLRWFSQIALALKHIHDRHILHRDLKTPNIFLAGPGQGIVKVGDFGIARVLRNTMDCAKTYVGTPYYCSPEICQQRPYSYKSDIWSLGCVLYETATLRHPFNADSFQNLLTKIVRGVAPPLPAAFSEDLRSLTAEMLMKDPHKRPSINELLQRPQVNKMIRHLIAEFGKQQDRISEKGRCKTPASQKSRHSSPTAAKSRCTSPSGEKSRCVSPVSEKRCVSPPVRAPPRREVRTPPKGQKAVNLKDQRGNLPRAAPKKLIRARSASNDSDHGRSVSPVQCKDITNQATVAKVGVVARVAAQQDLQLEAGTQKPQALHQQRGSKDEAASDQSKVLIRTLEEALNCKVPAGEKACIEDDPIPRHFMNPEGNEIKLQVAETDSLAYRIEALRLYIEKQLGISDFLLLYNHLAQSTETDMDVVLSSKLSKCWNYEALVTQLIVCEDKFYTS